MDICATCRKIPFHALPPEESPALPHHPTLGALKRSCAAGCRLCSMILYAAQDLCSVFLNGRSNNRAALPGGWLSHVPEKKNEKGESVTYNVYGGWYGGSGSWAGNPGYKGPGFTDTKEVFADDGPVTVWLFGNWWSVGLKGYIVGNREERVDKKEDDDGALQLVGLGVRLGTGPRIEDGEGNTKDTGVLRGTSIRIRVNFDDPMASVIPGRLRILNSDTFLGYKRVAEWLRICNKDHQCCPKDTPLPTRVLDVGHTLVSASVRLIEPETQKAKYIALSHCWGQSHRITTTKATVGKHKAQILLAELPKTFQDAVRITRMLNIQYLWIDSLCIIQDDDEDWEKEAAVMGFVYANAYLTISASSSTDDASGCFPTDEAQKAISFVSSDGESLGRPAIANAAPLMHQEYESSQKTYLAKSAYVSFTYPAFNATVFLTPEWMPSSCMSWPKKYLIGRFGKSFDPVAGEPISKRGWTLQERLLAPRMLHYGVEQMYWECQEYFQPEDGALFEQPFPKIWSLLSRYFEHPQYISDWRLSQVHELTPKYERFGRWGDGWLSLIESYTARELSREQDKLPALAGLAKTIAQHTGDKYVAGLWRHHILRGLMWNVRFYEPVHLCDDPKHDDLAPYSPWKSSLVFPKSYRAPSWSWASVDAQVQITPMKSELMAELVEVTVDTVGGEEFGRVKSGSIEIKGLLALIRPRSDPHPRKRGAFTTYIEAVFAKEVLKGVAYFDTQARYPSFGLFVDTEQALLLEQCSETVERENEKNRLGEKVGTYRDRKTLSLSGQGQEAKWKTRANAEEGNVVKTYRRIGIASIDRSLDREHVWNSSSSRDQRVIVKII